MKKKLLLVLMLIAAVVVMPRVSAAEGIKLGEVKDITNVDTLKSTTHKSFTHDEDYRTVTITYENAKFKLLDNGQSEGVQNRPEGYAWIGFKVAKPEGASKYQVSFNGGAASEAQTISADLEDYIGFKKENLEAAAKAGKNLEYTYEITWIGSDENVKTTQTIKVVINPAAVVLVAQDSEEEVWNTETYNDVKLVTVTVKAIKDGKVVELDEPLSYELTGTYTLSDEQIAELQKVLTDENLELVGLYTDADLKSEFDATEEITEDVTVYVAYKTKSAEVEEETESEEETPETLDNAIMFIALAGVSLAVVGGIALYLKKSN